MNVILIGCGKMGACVLQELEKDERIHVLGVVHPGLFERVSDVPGKADVVIDFSYPGNCASALARALDDGAALVSGTTGLTDAQEESIRAAADRIAVVRARNFSLGVAVLIKAVRAIKDALMDDFDAEIVETHHNQKTDAPSGTALALLQALDPENELRHVFGRSGQTGARGREIGVHALRGGTVAGEHSVFFFGPDETLEFRHSAGSRRIFAVGALRAARFAAGRAPGLYTMQDVLEV